jgi:hypothetical protein
MTEELWKESEKWTGVQYEEVVRKLLMVNH